MNQNNLCQPDIQERLIDTEGEQKTLTLKLDKNIICCSKKPQFYDDYLNKNTSFWFQILKKIDKFILGGCDEWLPWFSCYFIYFFWVYFSFSQFKNNEFEQIFEDKLLSVVLVEDTLQKYQFIFQSNNHRLRSKTLNEMFNEDYTEKFLNPYEKGILEISKFYQFALILEIQAKFQEANAIYDDLIQKEPSNIKYHIRRGQYLTRRRQFEEAKVAFDLALEINKDSFEAHLSKSVMLFKYHNQQQEIVDKESKN